MKKVFPYLRKKVYVLYGSQKDSRGRSLVLDVCTNRDVIRKRQKELQKLNRKNANRFVIVTYVQEVRRFR